MPLLHPAARWGTRLGCVAPASRWAQSHRVLFSASDDENHLRCSVDKYFRHVFRRTLVKMCQVASQAGHVCTFLIMQFLCQLCWSCCLLCCVVASATTCHARASGARSLLYSCRRSARARSGGSETLSCTKGLCASFQGGCQRTRTLRGCPAAPCPPLAGSCLESLMMLHVLLPPLQ